MAELAACLAEAQRLAQTDSPIVQRRVQMLREGLRFAELVATLDQRDADSARARQRFVRDNRFSWVVTSSYKGGGLASLGSPGIEELPPTVRPKLAGFPIVWKNPREDRGIVGVGYKPLDGMHVFLFLMADAEQAAECAFSVYLDADNDRSTGREKIGNDYYLSPGKHTATCYDKSRQSRHVPLDVCCWAGRAVIVGMKVERFAERPLAPKFALSIAGDAGKTPCVEIDTAKPPVETFSIDGQ